MKHAKKAGWVIIALAAMVIMFGCSDGSDTTVGVAGITLNESSKTLALNGEFTLTAEIDPAGASNQAVTWVSSNPTAVEVDGTDLTVTIKGKALADNVTVTVTTADGGKTASCTVNVVNEVATVSIPATLDLDVSGTAKSLAAVIDPANAQIGNSFTWSVAPATGVVTLSSTTGASIEVTPAATGDATATITVTTGNGKTASCAVSVNAPIRVAVKTQPGAADTTIATPDNPALVTLTAGKWTGTQEIKSNATGTALGTNGVARTTLLYVDKPMGKTAYTFRAKIQWPASAAGSIVFGEFMDPTAAQITIETTYPASGGTNWFSFDTLVGGGTGNMASGTASAYRGIAGIRLTAPAANGAKNVNGYGIMNDFLLGAGTLSTLPGATDEVLSSTSPIVWGIAEGGFVPEADYTLELVFDPLTGYTVKMFSGTSTTPISYTKTQNSVVGDTADAITLPITHFNDHFDSRDINIYPGIMLYNVGSVTISELELIQN